MLAPMMERRPEPELMDEGEQADAYAVADFAEVNRGFVEDFAARFPEIGRGRIVDLGCGPANITVLLAKKLPGVHVTGVDGAEAMLAHGRRAVTQAGLQDRVALTCGLIPGAVDGPFDAVVSNSLLHHLHHPEMLWQEIARIAVPGAPVFLMDLRRPESEARAQEIVETHAAHEREVLKRDFFASLCAAFTVDEVKAQLAAAKLSHLSIETPTDRHLIIVGRR
jgi:SAM-dependent methyltransferase